VLGEDGQTLAHVTPEDIDRMTASGTAHSGMIAKLGACRYALEGGVSEVAIVSGRGIADFDSAPGTRVRLPATSGRAS
jgi:acetylglutamate kinase